MPKAKQYIFLGIGISLMVIISLALIYVIKKTLEASDELLTDKSITIKAIVNEKIRCEDTNSGSFQRMDVIVLIANEFKLSLNINTIEDYLKYTVGEEILINVDDTGSISPIDE